MPDYITRSAQITAAVNTFTNVSTDPAGNTSQQIQVPANRSKLKEARTVVSLSAETATDSGGCIFLRLTGNGLPGGQQDVVAGAIMSIAQGTPATGIINVSRIEVIELDLDVTPGNTISAQMAYSGVDFGTPEVAVTLVFE